jgi:hypothetical protein
MSGGTRKAGTSPQTGAKSVLWTLFRPWESPLNLFDTNKVLILAGHPVRGDRIFICKMRDFNGIRTYIRR